MNLQGGLIVVFVLAVLAIEIPARADKMDPRLAAAEALYRTDGAIVALPEFERLAIELDASGDARGAAISIGLVGECYWRLGDFERAETVLAEALARKRAIGDREQEAKTINVQGLLAWQRGRYAQASASFEEVAAIARALGDAKLEGVALNNASLVDDEQGNYAASLPRYEHVLALFRRIDFQRGEGDVLGNIGGVKLLLGRFAEAERYYREALAISARLDSKTSLTQDHGNLAMSLLGQGKVAGAIAEFDLASRFAVEAGMRRDEAYWQRGKADALASRGDYDPALALLRSAIDTYAAIGADPERVEALHDLGALHGVLGDWVSAAQHYESALTLARTLGFARGVTVSLLALGDIAVRDGRVTEATELYRWSLERAREASETSAWIESLLRLAALPKTAGARDESMTRAQQALDLARETAARRLEAKALLTIADLMRPHDPSGALPHYVRAAEVAEDIGDPELRWRVHYGRATALASAGEIAAAVEELRAAVRIIESVRVRLAESRFRSGYTQDKTQVYIDLVRLQLQLGRTDDAFSTSEQLRAQSYVALVEERSQDVNDAAANREVELRERIRQLQRSLEEEDARGAPERRNGAILAFSEELVRSEREYEALLDDQRRTQRRFGTLAAPITRDGVSQRLADGEAMIEYLIDRDALVAFLITRSTMRAVTVDLAAADLASKTELLRDLINRRDSDLWRKPAASLAASLIEPVLRDGALAGVDKLLVVPHGVLNYLPFDVLLLHDSVLIDRFALSYLPSAAALALSAPVRDALPSMLVVAPARSRLRYAAEEASAVATQFEPNSQLLSGEAATESAFYAKASSFGNLHLVTHGYFNKHNPFLSGLELEPDATEDGLLEVHEIMGISLDADLVTLSACQTALGAGFFADLPAGDDFIGLTRAFLYAGSASVLATLWEVDDRSSGLLVERFYRYLRKSTGAGDKAQALAFAQREIRAMPAHRHPYYWAAFVLVGNGRVHDASTVSVQQTSVREIGS